MNMTNIIYQGQPGGLPFSITYTPDSDATQTLMLAGSAYSGTKYLLIGIELVFDGNVVATSAVWTNESESHKALSPGFGTVQFPLKFDDNGNIRSDEHGSMKGADVFNFVLKEIPKDIADLVNFSGTSLESLDYFFFHQANKFMNNYLARKLRLPRDKVPSSIEKFGNTSSV